MLMSKLWKLSQAEVTSCGAQGPPTSAEYCRDFLATLSCIYCPALLLQNISRCIRRQTRPGRLANRPRDQSPPRRMLLAISKRFSTSPTCRSALSMLATSTGPAVAGPNGKPIYHTVTALKRWSCDDRDLPAVNAIKAIHVYDFDNTRMVYARHRAMSTDNCSIRKSSPEQAAMEQCHNRSAGQP
jgi:hypothetical protein